MPNDTIPTAIPLNVEITRPDLIAWLATIPPQNLAAEVERTLAAGNLVLTLITASTGEEAMSRFFSPIVTRMTDLDGTIKKLLTSAQTSQRLGEIGETIVAEQLGRAFPNDQFEVTAKRAHEADICATFDVGGGLKQHALVEVKLYTNDVQTKELDKFRSDLASTGQRYGLMVSLSSRLAGVKGPVHLEEGPGYVAVYVPNAGTDGWGVMWGAALLKSIILYRERAAAGRVLPTGAVEQAWRRIEHEVATLGEIIGELRGMKEKINKARDAVLKPLDELSQTILASELRLSAALDRIQARLAEELTALPQTGVPLNLLTAAKPDAVLAALAALGTDKRAPTLAALYTVAQEAGLDIALGAEPGEWRLLRDGNEVAVTKASKTRVDLQVPLVPGVPVTFVPGLEEIKGDCVLIKGEKGDGFAARARAWLVGAGQ